MHLASGISTLLYFLKNSGQPATDRDAWSRPNTFQYEVLNFNSSDNHLVLARFEFYLSISQVSQIKTQLKHKRRDSSCNSAEIGTLSLSHHPIRKCAIQKNASFYASLQDNVSFFDTICGSCRKDDIHEINFYFNYQFFSVL